MEGENVAEADGEHVEISEPDEEKPIQEELVGAEAPDKDTEKGEIENNPKQKDEDEISEKKAGAENGKK